MKFNHFKSPFKIDTKQTIVAPAESGAHPHIDRQLHTPTYRRIRNVCRLDFWHFSDLLSRCSIVDGMLSRLLAAAAATCRYGQRKMTNVIYIFILRQLQAMP